MKRKPPCVTAHELDHHDPSVRLCARLKSTDGFRCKRHGAVEPEGGFGPTEIVVDGLGHEDDAHAHRLEACRDAQAAVAAKSNQAVRAELTIALHHAFAPVSKRDGSVGLPH